MEHLKTHKLSIITIPPENYHVKVNFVRNEH
jgi:hypothetical protein